MSEPIVIAAIIAGTFTLAGSVLAIVMSVLAKKDSASQATTQAAVLDGQNQLIGRLQADQERNDRRTGELQSRVDALELADGEKDARIIVLTQWGIWSAEDPPRTPPPWQRP